MSVKYRKVSEKYQEYLGYWYFNNRKLNKENLLVR